MREEGGVLKLAVRVGRRVEHDSRPLFFPSNQLTSAINCWRQTLCFKPKSVGLESAPFIRSVNKLPSADRDLLGNAHCVCPQLIHYPYRYGGARALDVQISFCSDYFRNINSVLYLIQMQGSPPPQPPPPPSAFAALLLGVHFLKRRLV